MKKILIAGNWKMNTTVDESMILIREIITKVNMNENVDILICPPFTSLYSASLALTKSKIILGGQNCHWHEKGAFTGEISVDMLKQIGCRYCIIGHSERRQLFFETDELINKKLKALLSKKINPIFCIGETFEQRQKGKTFSILENQLLKGLDGINEINNLVIAYEPVWAIGTGISASPEQVDETHNKIRNMLTSNYGESFNQVIILYGGSVTADNCHEILSLNNVNGALIGGASLKSEQFIRIIEIAKDLL